MCWYRHDLTVNEVEIESAKIKCNKCDKEFDNKPEFMKHKKQHHRQSVPACINKAEGNCIFGEDKCWFIHDDQEIENDSEDNQDFCKDQDKSRPDHVTLMMKMLNKNRVDGIIGSKSGVLHSARISNINLDEFPPPLLLGTKEWWLHISNKSKIIEIFL